MKNLKETVVDNESFVEDNLNECLERWVALWDMSEVTLSDAFEAGFQAAARRFYDE